MPKRPSENIASKAQARAEADFATWLMMAKLGSFDDLPPDARKWLTGYRTRLEQMPESDAMLATIREVQSAYYVQMGGEGETPALAANIPRVEDKVIDLKAARRARELEARSSPRSAPARSALPVPPLLIFAGMVTALAFAKFAFGF